LEDDIRYVGDRQPCHTQQLEYDRALDERLTVHTSIAVACIEIGRNDSEVRSVGRIRAMQIHPVEVTGACIDIPVGGDAILRPAGDSGVECELTSHIRHADTVQGTVTRLNDRGPRRNHRCQWCERRVSGDIEENAAQQHPWLRRIRRSSIGKCQRKRVSCKVKLG
jgi:hypothetical protein